MKNCNSCNTEKDADNFRIGHNSCKDCEKAYRREYYNRIKNDKNYKLKNKERLEKWKKENPEKYKANRKTEKYKKRKRVNGLKRYYRKKEVLL